jgi:hypothetical protein
MHRKIEAPVCIIRYPTPQDETDLEHHGTFPGHIGVKQYPFSASQQRSYGSNRIVSAVLSPDIEYQPEMVVIYLEKVK